jgi:linearmycin/streptolysin S transport system ATP-binding protein
MPAIIEVNGLVKRYGELAAVDGVSFTVEEGEIFGLLGPNGAGKTTTISMLSCLIEPTEGDATVAGNSIRTRPLSVKRALGVVPQDIALYPTLTALENLRFWAEMYGLKGDELKQRVAEVLAVAGLEDRAKERIETYSGGMKRRINIAAGMMHRPQVLVMDEPTVGIDPQSRNHILQTVRELNARGMTIVYTSHYMEEVEELCERVGIIDHGKLIALGTKDELRKLVGDEDVVELQIDHVPADAIERLTEVDGVTRADVRDGGIEVLSRDAGQVLAPVLSSLGEAGAHVRDVHVREPNLESVFLHLTGKSLRD